LDQHKSLDFAERWVRDGIHVCCVPAYFAALDVDMSYAKALIENARSRNVRITYAHILLRAAALTLAANPDLHKMVCGCSEYRPAEVDIALSVSGEMAAAPLLVIEGAERKKLAGIADEIVRRTAEVRAADRRIGQLLRRWGWLLPLGVLRRAILRALFRNYRFRRKGAGTFQLSVVPGVDSIVSPVFSSSAALFAGAVRDRVIALDGMPVVRPVITLTCCADHRVWDGNAGARFLTGIQKVLESSVLFDELAGASA